MRHLQVRSATPEDARPVAEIYNHYVRASVATFDTEEVTVADRIAWIAEHTGPYPALVGEFDGRVIAWGALSQWRTRCAWRHTVEISVYIAPDATGQGVGPLMTEALVAEATRLGHHAVISQITSENEPSLKMGSRMGFTEVGRLREVGRKFDRWLDVVLMELVLDSAGEDESCGS